MNFSRSSASCSVIAFMLRLSIFNWAFLRTAKAVKSRKKKLQMALKELKRKNKREK